MDKAPIRRAVWGQLEETGAARFPFPVDGRIPNFAEAERAAERVFDLRAWDVADTIKSNPDYAQYPVRVNALASGKDVYMAVPRLASEKCFIHLNGESIEDPDDAATIGGAEEHGTAVLPEALPQIDLIVVGSVAVTLDGVRIGKGDGFSDLEYAILREFDRVGPETLVVTTVHEHQVIDDSITPEPHDVPLDRILTPDRDIAISTHPAPPTGIDWSLLDDEDVQTMPVLARLRN